MGIKAFTVDPATGLRSYDEKGLARIEGSKHLSGGTGPTAYTWTDGKGNSKGPNGAPHVDESLLFVFDDGFAVPAQSGGVVLSDFDATDRLDLYLELMSGELKSFTSLDLSSHPALFTNLGDAKLWELQFALLTGLLESDVVTQFVIRANEPNPDAPKGTADHFLVSGMLFDDVVVITEIPEPATTSMLALGGLAMLRRRKK